MPCRGRTTMDSSSLRPIRYAARRRNTPKAASSILTNATGRHDRGPALTADGRASAGADYVVITRSAAEPQRDAIWNRSRIANRASFAALSPLRSRARRVPKPPVPIEGYIRSSSSSSAANGTTSRSSGTGGGDGDWAKERLAFGFMVENGYWGVLPHVEPPLAHHQVSTLRPSVASARAAR